MSIIGVYAYSPASIPQTWSRWPQWSTFTWYMWFLIFGSNILTSSGSANASFPPVNVAVGTSIFVTSYSGGVDFQTKNLFF